MSFLKKVCVDTSEYFLHVLEWEVVIICNGSSIPKDTSPLWVNASLLRI